MDRTAYLERANLLLQQGRPREAEEWARKALAEAPQDDHALSVLARCYFNGRQFDKGIATIQQAIAIDAGQAHYFYLLAFGHYQKNEYETAAKIITNAIAMAPWSAEFYGLRAYILLDQVKLKEALESANEGLAIDPENITCLNARATAQNKLRLTDDAIATMENALEQDPENEFTHATIGWNYLEKGKHKQATQHFREALRIDPGYHNAKAGLKEALKSKIPPYRWLLQFNFWLGNKGKNFRIVFLVAVFIGVRLITAAGKGNAEFENIAMVVGGAYLLFVATSWIINPLANAFLLFHKDGKYALEPKERWNAIAFMGCVFIAAILFGLGVLTDSDAYLGPFLVTLSLCIPAGHMQFPIRLRGNTVSQWLAIALLVLGVLILPFALGGIPGLEALFVLYIIGFVAYTWSSAF
ncbi:MAG: tetratricopeptide repeat protein [Chitinophagaceae bacterium]